MKWINPGAAELFTATNGSISTFKKSNATTSDEITAFNKLNADFITRISNGGNVRLNLQAYDIKELWASCDAYHKGWNDYDALIISFGSTLPYFKIDYAGYLYILTSDGKTTLYKSTDNIGKLGGQVNNFEIHIKTGENGRIDIWKNTKLLLSYRSPSAFADINIPSIAFGAEGYTYCYYSHFIIQETRRIGLEKFKKLTIDPDTEQNMPQGSTTTYKLSGLSDATEFSDITSVCALLQATSRDANISTGTFSLEGADVGTIDVSDSSGKAYEIAHAEVNSLTGKPWTRDDIEGKTLSFKVNGAS